jgi:hypothetical protein
MIRLALRVRRSDAELVLADLLELAPSGVEEIELPAGDGGEGMIEYAVYGAPGELPLLPDVRAAAGGGLVEISTSEVADDWSERWKQFHRPVLIEARAPGGPRIREDSADGGVAAVADPQDGNGAEIASTQARSRLVGKDIFSEQCPARTRGALPFRQASVGGAKRSRRCARDRDRSCASLWHRRARDHSHVSGAAVGSRCRQG